MVLPAPGYQDQRAMALIGQNTLFSRSRASKPETTHPAFYVRQTLRPGLLFPLCRYSAPRHQGPGRYPCARVAVACAAPDWHAGLLPRVSDARATGSAWVVFSLQTWFQTVVSNRCDDQSGWRRKIHRILAKTRHQTAPSNLCIFRA